MHTIEPHLKVQSLVVFGLMNKIKLVICIFLSLFLISCDKEVEKEYEVEYPSEVEIDYSNMDSFSCYKIENDIKHDYTFYIESGRIVNASVKVQFDSEEDTINYYETIKDNEEYTNITRENTIISYFHNLETFIYTNYPKDILIDLLKENNFIFDE